MILDTEDELLLNHIEAVFALHGSDIVMEKMPPEFRNSLNRSLDQSSRNEVVAHETVKNKYRKWLKS